MKNLWKTAMMAALVGCVQADAHRPITEDDLPEDIYSVQQTYQAHYDSVLEERETLLETVLAGAPSTRAYREAKDARGKSFAADGVVQDHIERCLDLNQRMSDETIPETIELLVALNDGRVGIERFKLRFAKFDGDWIDSNDCWRSLWEDPTFAAWRVRHKAQADSVSREETARRMAEDARRRAELERLRSQRAFEACVTQWLADIQFRTIGPYAANLFVKDDLGDQYVAGFNRAPREPYRLTEMPEPTPAWVDRDFWAEAEVPPSYTGQPGPLHFVRNALYEQWAAGGHPGCSASS